MQEIPTIPADPTLVPPPPAVSPPLLTAAYPIPHDWQPAMPASVRRGARARTLSGFFAVALLSATLASGGTLLALKSAGGLNSGTPIAVGTGVTFESNGWILTNHHVVAGSDTLTVELTNGKTYPGTVYGVDTLTDLAIVKIEATGLPTATLGDSGNLKVGQLAIAI